MFEEIIKQQIDGSRQQRPSLRNQKFKSSQQYSNQRLSDNQAKIIKGKNLKFTQILNKNKNSHKLRLEAYLDHYEIFREEPNQQQVILRAKNNYNIDLYAKQTIDQHNNFVMMKQLKIDNYYDLKRVIENLQLQKELSHENLLSLIWYEVRSQVKVAQQGQFRKVGNPQGRVRQPDRVKYKNLKRQQIEQQREIHIITLLYQYYPVTIQQEISNRALEGRYFEQLEVWSLLYSCVSGLAYLEKKNICHSSVSDFDIFLTQDGFVKVIDPSIATYAPLEQYTPGFYYSPQILKIYKQKGCQANGIIGYTNSLNIFKADVYSLGMLLMEVCLLQNCSNCYDYQLFIVQGIVLRQKFNRLTKYYSTKLLDIIYQMINFKPQNRPNFQQLQAIIVSILNDRQQKLVVDSIHSIQENLLQSKQFVHKDKAKILKKPEDVMKQQKVNKRLHLGKQLKKTKNKIKSQQQPCVSIQNDQQDILPVDSLANEYATDLQKINQLDSKDTCKQLFQSIKDSFVKQIRKFQHSLQKQITSQTSVKQNSYKKNTFGTGNSINQFDIDGKNNQQQNISVDKKDIYKIRQQTETSQIDESVIKIVISAPKQQQLRKTQKKQFQFKLSDNISDLNKTQEFTSDKKQKKQKNITSTGNDEYLRKRLQQIKQQNYYRYLPQDQLNQQKIRQQFAQSFEIVNQKVCQSQCTKQSFFKMVNEDIAKIQQKRRQIQTKLSKLR